MTTRTKSPRWIAALLAGALVAFGGVARAGDEGEEAAAALVRRARTAEAVDRDVQGAIALYRKAIEAGVTGDAVKEAWVRLARLLEQTGKNSEALTALTTLTDRFADKLSDAEKKEVHEAMGRLLPPGAHGRSPLGDVFVRAAGEAASGPDARTAAGAPSPMDAKIVALLAKYEAADPQSRESVRDELINILRPVGADAVPALTRALRSESPVRAKLAAELVAMFGGVPAVAALEKTIVEGDPFARGAAIEGLAQVTTRSPETSAALVAAVDRLMAMPALADRRQRLRSLEASHLSSAELLARYDAGGEGAGEWLMVAVARSAPTALARVLEIAKVGGVVDPAVVESLATAAGPVGGPNAYWVEGRLVVKLEPRSNTLDAASRLTILRVLLAQEPTQARLAQAAAVAGVLLSNTSATTAREAAEAVWSRVLGVADESVREAAARSLLDYGVGIPPTVLAKEPERRAFEAVAGRLAGQGVLWMLLHPAAEAGNDFWVPFLRALSTAVPTDVAAVVNNLIGPSDSKWEVAEQLVAALEAGASPVPAILQWLSQIGQGSIDWSSRPPLHQAQALPIAGLRERILKVLLSQERSGLEDQVARVASALMTGDATTADAVRRQVWARVMTQATTPAGKRLAYELLLGDVQPPDEAYRDSAGRETIARAWVGLANAVSAATAAQAAIQSGQRLPEFWEVVFTAWRVEGPQRAKALLGVVHGVVTWDAKGLPDARWLDVLAAYAGPQGGWPDLALRGAARTNDPRFLEVLRAGGFLRARDKNVTRPAMSALLDYAGPGRDAAIREVLDDPQVADETKGGVLGALGRAPAGSPDRKILVDVAAKGSDVRFTNAAAQAVERLAAAGDRETLATLVAAQTEAAARNQDAYRLALIYAARTLHLKEAVPFLLEQFRGGYEKAASDALDDIRSYYERAALYEDLAQGATERRKDLSKLLDDPDPEIRRAAVLSLGAMGDKEALPRLVRIAKEEKDARVRSAALEAVERLARTTPAAPAPTPSKPGG